MIDVAVAGIYSFASEAYNQMQSKDFLDRLCSLDQKVADFFRRDSNIIADIIAEKRLTIWTALKKQMAPFVSPFKNYYDFKI